MRIARRTAVLVALAAGAVILGTGAQPWIESTGISGLVTASVTTTGNQAAAVVPAMGLVGLAAGIALSMARRIGRWVTGVLMVLAGAAAGMSAVTAALDPATAAQGQVSAASGTTSGAAEHVVTAWPWFTLAGGALLVLCGLAVLFLGRGWTSSRRHESPVSRGGATPAAPATSVAAGGATGATTGATTGASTSASTGASGTRAERDLDEIDAWDELTRGGDPTAS